MDGAVTVDPGHGREGGRGDGDAPVAFARAVVAGMARVQGALVYNNEVGRRECGLERGTNLRFESHFSVSPPSIPARLA